MKYHCNSISCLFVCLLVNTNQDTTTFIGVHLISQLSHSQSRFGMEFSETVGADTKYMQESNSLNRNQN